MAKLTEIQSGNQCFVVRIHGGGRERVQRLADMGIFPGEMLKVVSNQGHGPVTIVVKGTRMALGHTAASSLEVREISGVPPDPKRRQTKTAG